VVQSLDEKEITKMVALHMKKVHNSNITETEVKVKIKQAA
jgi:predicted small metal-binding protein